MFALSPSLPNHNIFPCARFSSARVMLHIYPACLMYALQSAVVIVLNAIGVIVFTRNFLILLNTTSAGFRSGLYGERNRTEQVLVVSIVSGRVILVVIADPQGSALYPPRACAEINLVTTTSWSVSCKAYFCCTLPQYFATAMNSEMTDAVNPYIFSFSSSRVVL